MDAVTTAEGSKGLIKEKEWSAASMGMLVLWGAALRSKGAGLLLLLSIKAPPKVASGVMEPGVDTSLIRITEVKGEVAEGEAGTDSEEADSIDVDAKKCGPASAPPKGALLGGKGVDLRSGLSSNCKSLLPSEATEPPPPGSPPSFVSASVAFFLSEDFLHNRNARAIKPRASSTPTLEPAAVAVVAAAALLDRAAEAASTPPPPMVVPPPPAPPIPIMPAPKDAVGLKVGSAEG